MAESIANRYERKPTKPYLDFPLFAHASGGVGESVEENRFAPGYEVIVQQELAAIIQQIEAR